jgi:hypothetical protein
VALSIGKSGFIRRVEAVERGRVTGPGGGVPKELTITRLAVPKAAAEFAATRPEVESRDVLKIAASWERWVTRGDA